MSPEAHFTVGLHHLAPDLGRVGTEFPDTERRGVGPGQLRELIERLTLLAPATLYPAEPELRINGPSGRFLVQVRNGEIRVTSWSAQSGGANLSPNQILAMIMGMEQAGADMRPRRADITGVGSGLARRWKVALLVMGVVGSNGVTAWMLTRPPAPPPKSLLPEYRVVTPAQARRVLGEFAGDYETGNAQGDRGLTISADGRLRWTVWGPDRSVAEETALGVQAAESRGRPVLVAENHGMIEMKDPVTLVYFGDTYRRKKTPGK